MTSVEERFATALYHVSRSWRQALGKRLKDLGVGQTGWMVITAIAKSEKPLAQTELAHVLGIEDASLVSMLDRLEKAGLVYRMPSDSDRRVKLVALTQSGTEVFAKVKVEASAFRREVLGRIEKSSLRMMTEMLEDMQKFLEPLS